MMRANGTAVRDDAYYGFSRFDGPFAIVGSCHHCKFTDTVRKAPKGTAGRGWGMREGNKQRGRMIQHAREAHADRIK